MNKVKNFDFSGLDPYNLRAMLETQQIWTQALSVIEIDISRANFGTWFRNTKILKQELGTVYLGVPNPFVKDWLCTKYHKVILRSLRGLLPEIRGVEYVVIKNNEEAKISHSILPRQFPREQAGQLNLNDLYVNREDNLNPRYDFNNFIVGPFNELAYAAAQAIVKKIVAYNPLFIYGGTGLGKTHLTQAAGNAFKKHHPQIKPFYLTSEQFTVEYVTAVQNNKVNGFKEKYRKYDVLIMDDVQFLSNKERTQQELFHLFNHFYENNKQIIFSSDKPPKYLANIEDRLRSRFAGGMIVDIAKPDYESRLAILRSKLENNIYHIADEITEYVASMVQDNIRELEGSLNSILCQCQLKNRGITLAEAKELIKNNIKPKKTISIKNIASIVSDFYNIEEKMIYEKTRKKEIVKPRQVIMYILREDFNTSFPYIGQKMGGRDHTTVIHAHEKIKDDLKKNSLLGQEIEQIRGLIYKD